MLLCRTSDLRPLTVVTVTGDVYEVTEELDPSIVPWVADNVVGMIIGVPEAKQCTVVEWWEFAAKHS